MIRRALVNVLAVAAICALSLSVDAQTPTPPPAATVPSVPKVDEKKYGSYPIAYRELITRWLQTELLDAATAKIEWLGEPQPIQLKGADGRPFFGYVVDFKVNARNKFGTYTGFQKRRVYIRNGEVAAGGRKTL